RDAVFNAVRYGEVACTVQRDACCGGESGTAAANCACGRPVAAHPWRVHRDAFDAAVRRVEGPSAVERNAECEVEPAVGPADRARGGHVAARPRRLHRAAIGVRHVEAGDVCWKRWNRKDCNGGIRRGFRGYCEWRGSATLAGRTGGQHRRGAIVTCWNGIEHSYPGGSNARGPRARLRGLHLLDETGTGWGASP